MRNAPSSEQSGRRQTGRGEALPSGARPRLLVTALRPSAACADCCSARGLCVSPAIVQGAPHSNRTRASLLLYAQVARSIDRGELMRENKIEGPRLAMFECALAAALTDFSAADRDPAGTDGSASRSQGSANDRRGSRRRADAVRVPASPPASPQVGSRLARAIDEPGSAPSHRHPVRIDTPRLARHHQLAQVPR